MKIQCALLSILPFNLAHAIDCTSTNNIDDGYRQSVVRVVWLAAKESARYDEICSLKSKKITIGKDEYCVGANGTAFVVSVLPKDDGARSVYIVTAKHNLPPMASLSDRLAISFFPASNHEMIPKLAKLEREGPAGSDIALASFDITANDFDFSCLPQPLPLHEYMISKTFRSPGSAYAIGFDDESSDEEGAQSIAGQLFTMSTNAGYLNLVLSGSRVRSGASGGPIIAAEEHNIRVAGMVVCNLVRSQLVRTCEDFGRFSTLTGLPRYRAEIGETNYDENLSNSGAGGIAVFASSGLFDSIPQPKLVDTLIENITTGKREDFERNFKQLLFRRDAAILYGLFEKKLLTGDYCRNLDYVKNILLQRRLDVYADNEDFRKLLAETIVCERIYRKDLRD